MMAPTVVLRDGRPELALGSAGSNRIRSAILQTVLAVVDGGARAEDAVTRRGSTWRAARWTPSPGIDPERARRARAARLDGPPLGGAKPLLRRGAGGGAATRDSGELTGAGDPRAAARSGGDLTRPTAVELPAAIFRRPSNAFARPGDDPVHMAERLSAIDGSFLRLETANAHMHVLGAPPSPVPEGVPRPTLTRLRAASRPGSSTSPSFRRRLARPPPGWASRSGWRTRTLTVEARARARHARTAELDDRRFALLCDSALSRRLTGAGRSGRSAWPRARDGRCRLVAKIHHALVDGRSAVEVAQLLFDASPDRARRPRALGAAPPRASRAGRRGARGWRGGVAASARSAERRGWPAPRAQRPSRLAERSAARHSRPGRTCSGPRPPPRSTAHRPKAHAGAAPSLMIEDVLGAKGAAGVTVNDVCLATVAGALRRSGVAAARSRRRSRRWSRCPCAAG